ncbi:hypothetical protein L7F22_066076 [Adiantum nelumboides]|nr:hypothetical protein [Adiantum nelumboides]
MNGTQVNHEKKPEAEQHIASSDQPQKPIESGTQCAETGDVPLPSHSSHDLDEIHQLLSVTEAPMSQHKLEFANGLFLAPMVRIGSLPTRLLSLQYGADLVWSPEIVDRAIIGCDRTVNQKTGLIAYSREGKHIFTTHPIERDRLIFQLGSSSPEWAYKAIKFITAHDEVAGVDLNCGCPKSFSTIGGMGAQLLSTPDLLCDILKAMRIAPATCFCYVQNSSLTHERRNAKFGSLQEVKEIVDQESNGKLPLICNGDAWDASEAQSLMRKTGVSAVMMARGPEGNPSCFRSEGVLSVPEIIAPEWVKLAIALDNQYGNTKYCLQSLAMKPSSSIVPGAPALKTNCLRWNKQKLGDIRASISQAKSVDEMASALGVDANEIRSIEIDKVLKKSAFR